MVLPKIPARYVKKLNSICTNFIWGGKKAKIGLKTLQGKRKEGGMELVNFEWKNLALKTTWVKILQEDTCIKNLAANALKVPMEDLVWEANLCHIHVENMVQTQNIFWVDVIKAWTKVNFKQNVERPKEQIIWLNSHILVGGTPVNWKEQKQKGLITLGQLYSNNKLRSALEVARQYGLDFLQYNMLISAVPKQWKEKIAIEMQDGESSDKPSFYETFTNQKHPARVAYAIAQESVDLCSKQKKLEGEIKKQLKKEEFIQYFRNIWAVTNIPKYRSFQYRLLHGAIVTNTHLHRWKVIDSNMCTFCKENGETYEHLFVMCKYVQPLWVKIEEFLNEYSNRKIKFDREAVLCNSVIEEKPGHIKNFIVLMVKQYIYRQRCWKKLPIFNEVKNEIEQCRNVEHYYAVKSKQLIKHFKKWTSEKNNSNEQSNDSNNIVLYST